MNMESPSASPNRRPRVPLFHTALDAAVVHRVLLTDPSEFHTLTVSGESPDHDTTPAFEDFSNALQQQYSPEMTIKKAYRDHVCEAVNESQKTDALQQIMLELHDKIRALVPNRTDLHGILKDDQIKSVSAPSEMLPLVIAAAQGLQKLESEARSESTHAWLQQHAAAFATTTSSSNMESKSLVEFLVTSIMYLITKAELCEQDKHDYYLTTVWAPQIHTDGYQYERDMFEMRFAKFDDHSTAPLTRQWISSLVAARDRVDPTTRQKLQSEQSARQELFIRGWVEDILFRSPASESLALPEILALDLDNLNQIRDATRRAAAGSALALHACNAAGVPSSVLSQQYDMSSPISIRQKGIAEAMITSRQAATTIQEYERAVASQVVALAKEWNASISTEAVERLTNLTSSVLRAEDPVIQLLDGRMREVFTEMVTRPAQKVPSDMRTGRSSDTSNSGIPGRSSFLRQAESEFCKRGLSFYASDLAAACLLAKKVIELAWKLYGDAIVDEMIVEACKADRTTVNE